MIDIRLSYGDAIIAELALRKHAKNMEGTYQADSANRVAQQIKTATDAWIRFESYWIAEDEYTWENARKGEWTVIDG